MALYDDQLFGVSAVRQADNDMNKNISSGFFLLSGSVVNGPPAGGTTLGQLIVSRNNTSILQIITGLSNGKIYFRNGNPAVIGGGGDWSFWRPMGAQPVRFVDDNTGSMYGEEQGGLNTINVFRATGVINKRMPAFPVPGDEVTIVVVNGLNTNTIAPDTVSGSMVKIMGLNEAMTLDEDNCYRTFVYIDASLGWRVKK